MTTKNTREDMPVVSRSKFGDIVSMRTGKALKDLTKDELCEEFFLFYKWAVTTINSERKWSD